MGMCTRHMCMCARGGSSRAASADKAAWELAGGVTQPPSAPLLVCWPGFVLACSATGFSQDLQDLLMSGSPMAQQQQPNQPSTVQQQQPVQPVQQPAPAAAVGGADGPAPKGVRSPSPPNKGAPTFNGRNWL